MIAVWTESTGRTGAFAFARYWITTTGTVLALFDTIATKEPKAALFRAPERVVSRFTDAFSGLKIMV